MDSISFLDSLEKMLRATKQYKTTLNEKEMDRFKGLEDSLTAVKRKYIILMSAADPDFKKAFLEFASSKDFPPKKDKLEQFT